MRYRAPIAARVRIILSDALSRTLEFGAQFSTKVYEAARRKLLQNNVLQEMVTLRGKSVKFQGKYNVSILIG